MPTTLQDYLNSQGTTPHIRTTATFEEPYAGAMRRGFLESGAALAKQPIPIPIQKVAPLDPYEMRSRELASGLGGFTPYIKQGGQMMHEGAGYYSPSGIESFYNPYEESVIDQAILDAQKVNEQQGIKDRFNALSSGAYGGSRGRLMEKERESAFGRGLTEGIAGLRARGYDTAGEKAFTAGQGLGTMGTNFANLGITGQTGLQNQINTFDKLGTTGRNIQDAMNTAQFTGAQTMAAEPWARLNKWQDMLGALPPTRATTTWNPLTNKNDYLNDVLGILGVENTPDFLGAYNPSATENANIAGGGQGVDYQGLISALAPEKQQQIFAILTGLGAT